MSKPTGRQGVPVSVAAGATLEVFKWSPQDLAGEIAGNLREQVNLHPPARSLLVTIVSTVSPQPECLAVLHAGDDDSLIDWSSTVDLGVGISRLPLPGARGSIAIQNLDTTNAVTVLVALSPTAAPEEAPHRSSAFSLASLASVTFSLPPGAYSWELLSGATSTTSWRVLDTASLVIDRGTMSVTGAERKARALSGGGRNVVVINDDGTASINGRVVFRLRW